MPDILLVEDEPVVRAAALRACDPAGLKLVAACTVEEGVECLRAAPYRLALVDLMLPGPPGFALLEWACAERPAMPVIVVSGYATIENTLKSFELGAFDFIPKPFDIDELLSVVRRGLRYCEISNARGETRAGSSAAPSPSPFYSLGRHAWARPDPDGTSTLGVAETFALALGEVAEIEMPEPDHREIQGKRLLSIRDTEGLDHRVWSPLGGRVIEANRRAVADPDLILRDPFGSGWLVRMIPANLESQLPALTRRGVGAGPTLRR